MSVKKISRSTVKCVSQAMPPMETGKPYEVRYEGSDGKEEIAKGACVKIGGPSAVVVIRHDKNKIEIPYENIMDVTPLAHVVDPMPEEVEAALKREGITAEGEILSPDFDAQYNHGKRVDVASKVHNASKDKKVRVTFNVSVDISFSVTSNMIVDAAQQLNIPAVNSLEFVKMEKI